MECRHPFRIVASRIGTPFQQHADKGLVADKGRPVQRMKGCQIGCEVFEGVPCRVSANGFTINVRVPVVELVAIKA